MPQKFFVFLAAGFLSLSASGISSPCCGTDSLRILASLQELRHLDFSLTTSLKEVYARYDGQGKLSRLQGPSDLTFHFTSIARLYPELQIFGRVPFLFRSDTAAYQESRGPRLGELLLGMQRTLYQSLYLEDPVPTVSILATVKAPTGLTELGTVAPRAWEPYLGFALQKERFHWLGNMDFGVSLRQRELLLRGSQSLGYTISQPWQLGIGSQQILSLNASQKMVSLFSFVHLALGQFTLVGAQLDWSLPIPGLGSSQDLTRTASFSLRYTFL